MKDLCPDLVEDCEEGLVDVAAGQTQDPATTYTLISCMKHWDIVVLHVGLLPH